MENFPLWGTVVNTVAVLFGGLLGLLLKTLLQRKKSAEPSTEAQDENPQKPRRNISDTVMKGLGLAVVLIGISGALTVNNMLVLVVSLALGSLVGELLDLDGLVNRFGNWIEKKMKGKAGGVAEGFVSCTLLFCVGAMSVNGAIEAAVNRTHGIYYVKSLLDCVSATVFGSTLGFGVLLSAGSVFAVQSVLVLIAVLLAGAIPTAITAEMIAVGSLLVVAIGTNLMGVTKIKVMNLLPAMFFPIALCPLFSLFM